MIISYESGDLTDVEVVELFAELVSNGMAWSLQGHYGRTAMGFIETNIISKEGVIDYDRLYEVIS